MHAGDFFVLKVNVKTRLKMECTRCLSDFEQDFVLDIEEELKKPILMILCQMNSKTKKSRIRRFQVRRLISARSSSITWFWACRFKDYATKTAKDSVLIAVRT